MLTVCTVQAELLFLLREVGTTNEADDYLLS